jgi:calcineurin-like phosphoesterase
VPTAIAGSLGGSTNDPLRKGDQILANLDAMVKVRFVDFHAELASEKATSVRRYTVSE